MIIGFSADEVFSPMAQYTIRTVSVGNSQANGSSVKTFDQKYADIL